VVTLLSGNELINAELLTLGVIELTLSGQAATKVVEDILFNPNK
jgi:hypothetical protein